MADKYIKVSECEKYFYEHLDDLHITAAMNAIDEMPAVDMVEVVRCKDCRYYDIKNLNCKYLAEEAFLEKFRTYEDDFCSYGEKCNS